MYKKNRDTISVTQEGNKMAKILIVTITTVREHNLQPRQL